MAVNNYVCLPDLFVKVDISSMDSCDILSSPLNVTSSFGC